jgi:hypothetical protein
VRHSDQLARLGGDEFVVVLEDLGDVAARRGRRGRPGGDKILSALGQPYQLGSHVLFKTRRASASRCSTAPATDIETLLKQADLAMYRAKADGRNAPASSTPACRTRPTAAPPSRAGDARRPVAATSSPVLPAAVRSAGAWSAPKCWCAGSAARTS